MQLLIQIMPYHTPLTIQVRLILILGNITQQQTGKEISMLPSLFIFIIVNQQWSERKYSLYPNKVLRPYSR